jgi:hypothetical protein
LRATIGQWYDISIAKFRGTKGWSKEINYNIGVKQGCHLSPTLFGICIDKLEHCFEAADCIGPTLASIVIILLLYAILMARNPYDLNKQLKILKDLCSSTRMTVNIDKTKVMIIKSQNITYNSFIYDDNSLEEVPSYKYLGIDIHDKFN